LESKGFLPVSNFPNNFTASLCYIQVTGLSGQTNACGTEVNEKII